MKIFKDNKGRQWELSVTPYTVKRVRDVLKTDVLTIYTDPKATIFSDPCLLVDIIFVMIQKQASEKNVSDEDFGGSMVGDVLEDAATALMEDVADFFPSPKQKTLRKILAKGKTVAEIMQEKADQAIDSLDPTSLISVTNSLASSELTPAT